MKFGGTFKLFKITMAMRQLLDRIEVTGEDDNANEAMLLKQGDKMDDQIYACMGYALELEAQVKARTDAMDRMAAANERDLKKASFLKTYVLRAIQFAELPLPRRFTEFEITLKKNPPSAEVYSLELLPEEYLRWTKPKPAESAPDKAKIKADLAQGVIIPGCKLSDTTYRVEVQ